MAEAETQDLLFLLTLPEHLQKTLTVLVPGSPATADDVSRLTGRARAVESSYLNQLATMGILDKKRNGRKAFFFYRRAKTELKEVIRRLKRIPAPLRKVLLEDTYTAFTNRIQVFEKIGN